MLDAPNVLSHTTSVVFGGQRRYHSLLNRYFQEGKSHGDDTAYLSGGNRTTKAKRMRYSYYTNKEETLIKAAVPNPFIIYNNIENDLYIG